MKMQCGLKEYAADVLAHHRQMKEDRKPQIEEIAYSDFEDELKEEIEEHFYIDLDLFIEEKGFVPEEKHLKKITKGIIDAYIRYSHLRIIPDDAWNEQMKQVLATVIADLEEDGIVSQSLNQQHLETQRPLYSFPLTIREFAIRIFWQTLTGKLSML